MENSTLRNFVLSQSIITKLNRIDYVRDPYPHAKFRLISLDGEFPTNTWNITTMWLFVPSLFSHMWLFVPSLFSHYRLAARSDYGLRRPMAQNARNLARMNLLGVLTENGCPSLAPKFWKFCITKAVFSLQTGTNLAASATKLFRSRIGIWPREFQIFS